MRRSLSLPSPRGAKRETACVPLPPCGGAFLSSVVFLFSSSFLLCASVSPPSSLGPPSASSPSLPSAKASSFLPCERGLGTPVVLASSHIRSPSPAFCLFLSRSRDTRSPLPRRSSLSLVRFFLVASPPSFLSFPPLPSCLSLRKRRCLLSCSSVSAPPASSQTALGCAPRAVSALASSSCSSFLLSTFLRPPSPSAFSSVSSFSGAPCLPWSTSTALISRRLTSGASRALNAKERKNASCNSEAREPDERIRNNSDHQLREKREKTGAKKMELDGREAGVIEEAPPLVLEEEEERLFDMLVRCVEDLKLNIVLRAAGGWVRDKLMKRRSDDIDIAIDKCTGVEFATNLNSWLRAQGLPTHAIGVVASNPDQSKHLETATCRLANHQVDFVHLRTETYSEHSRIPENVGFGTPEEDAQRRDFTLNALFYNLHTKKVENFTKTGLEDLRRRVLRTPLENAKETLLDDPLRVLRGVRLAALLRLQLHDEVVKGAQTRAVREGLRKKVSRERLGIELKKMLSGSAAAGEDARDARDTERGEAAQASGDRTQAGDGPTSPKKRRKDEAAQQDAEGEEGAEGGEDAEGEEDAEEEEDGDGEQGDGKTGAADQAEATRVRAENLRKEVVHNIARATAAATQGFLLLAELRVVESVFSLPDRVLVPQEGLSATAGKGEGARLAQGASAPGMQGEGDNRAGKHAAKKAEQNGKQAGKDVILSSEDDLLKGWWKDGLRCMHALNSLVTAAASSPSSEEAEIMRDLLRTPTRAEAPTEPEKAHSNGKANEGDAETDKKDAARSSDWRDSVRALNLAAFLFPLATRECLNEKKKPEDLLFHMVVTGLKLSKKDGSRALDLNKGARAFLRFLNEQSDAQQRSLYASAPHGAEAKEESQRAERIQLGLLLREAGGDIWPQALLLAAAIDQTRKTPSVSSLVASRDKDERRTEEEEAKEVAEATERAKLPVSADALKTFAELKKKIVALGLADAHRQPPLCDGHRVKTLLKNLPKGPLFKEILDEQIKWQLGHPAGTAAEYEEYLTGKYSAYV